jgi:DnaJ like chaperone protein
MLFAIIFSIIGLALWGLGGAFGGFLLGSIFDSIRNSSRARKAQEEFNKSRQEYYNDPRQFEEQLLTLIGYVARSDNNRLLQSEFDYCKKYFQKTFPHSDLSQLMLKFRDILDSENISESCRIACGKISQYATIHEKIAILQCLFGFATADGNVHQNEVEAIHRISSWCGVNEITYEAIKLLYMSSSYTGGYSGDSYGGGYGGGYSGGYSGNTYQPRSGPSLDDCYKILEVSPNATDDEVKKAYRTAAMKYHPDKVSHLGEDVRKKAEEQFAKVNEAYDKIKAARGMK